MGTFAVRFWTKDSRQSATLDFIADSAKGQLSI